MDDLISRSDALQALDGEIKVIGKASAEAVFEYTKMVSDRIKALPSARQNRIARETAEKSPDEIYDFLYWLMSYYGMQFTDSRAAVIEWLKEERRE